MITNETITPWYEHLNQVATQKLGTHAGIVFQQYQHAFTHAYQESFNAAESIEDIVQLEKMLQGESNVICLYPTPDRGNVQYALKLFFEGTPPSISKTLPILENMGVKVYEEIPFKISRTDGRNLWMSCFALAAETEALLLQLSTHSVQNNLKELLGKVFQGKVENDGFNALTVGAGLAWREVVLLRALAKYLKQGGMPFSQSYIEQCLIHYPNITQNLVTLFTARLHPQNKNEQQAEKLHLAIKVELEHVSNLDEDRMINGLLTVILSIVRTNFWQMDLEGQPKDYISFKLQPRKIEFLPEPRPLFEIWIYSPQVEGVHLRHSKVARGGIRWSDRMEDFRTEVLGLVKAQQVKNSIIVPMGSKGGFVCKQLPPSKEREAFAAEGIACYKIYISALLDITDNVLAGKIVPPKDVIRLDEDDPYLVVAADKGTAKFSDIANGISACYQFWLGDAFASGGSAGYDHKAMAITARGAWESVKCHFRHLNKNIQTEDFTVVGIGDMAGDVFGNGMLLSEHICLKAAFNHMHIFLDPNPDARLSFIERARLFELPGCTWADYDKNLLSKGGGIFERSAKSIPLSAEIKHWLNLRVDTLSPNELIHELLQADVELIYNGGIGTYLKGSNESHMDVHDRANDSVRVNGNQVKAKVFGEGGNLGCTQKGRIEYALNGGLICTDAIDNSAGVDCSDHEVNIKILLGHVVHAGQLQEDERNILLKSMTEDVRCLVLRNNYLQTQALSMNREHSKRMLNPLSRLMQSFEKSGELNRALEFLPTNEELQSRKLAQIGFTAPEVAVLLSYSKIHLDQALLKSAVPDDEDFSDILVHYFPKALQQRFAKSMQSHHLRREIIANQLANQIVNRMGITFVFRVKEESGVAEGEIARAYWAASQILDAEALFIQLEALDNQVPVTLQIEFISRVRRSTERIARQILRQQRPNICVRETVQHYQASFARLLLALPQLVQADEYNQLAKEQEELAAYPAIDPYFAQTLVRLEFTESFLDIIDLAEKTKMTPENVAREYFAAALTLDIDWLRRGITALPRENRWQALARQALRADSKILHKTLLEHVLSQSKEKSWQAWQAENQEKINTIRPILSELKSYDVVDLAMLFALIRKLSHILI